MLCMLMSVEDTPDGKRKIEQLYEVYNPLLFAVAGKILIRQEDVEDAVFHAWEKIITHMDNISEIDCKETRSFVVIITERVAIDHYRKLKRQYQISVEEFEEHPYFQTCEKGFSEIETMEWLRSMPKKYSEVLILYYVHEYSIREIADMLELREGTVASRLSRGRKMLQSGKEGM